MKGRGTGLKSLVEKIHADFFVAIFVLKHRALIFVNVSKRKSYMKQ